MIQDLLDTVSRQSYGKLVAYLASRGADLAAAEDALSEAFVAALSDWPRSGCPANPEAWLLTVARRKLIDGIRRQRRGGEILATQSVEPEETQEIPDRRLALMFVCAHPEVDSAARAPLILQTILGLNAKTISAAFLTSPEAMGKRLVRAKEKIRQSGIPFRIPDAEELPERLCAVLDAIYAAFAEGWSDPSAGDVIRRELSDESIYLSRILTGLLPTEPEVMGLLALQLHLEARRASRRGPNGEYIPLTEQDPKQWHFGRIAEAEEWIRKASTFNSPGRYQLEAALQSAHVFRRVSGRDNWSDIVHLYDALLSIHPSPVVAINRAVAVAELAGPEVGFEAMPTLCPALREYQPYWAARADLLARLGRSEEAHHAYDVAIGLEKDPSVRQFLFGRQSRL